MDIITQTAKDNFHISYLFPYQRLVISNILRKAGLFTEEEAAEAPPNQVVLLPTGAGKSLCFMLPAALLPGLTVVIFPLLGLMADQLRRVEEAGMKGALLKDTPFNLVRAHPDRVNILYEVRPVLSRMQDLESLMHKAERPALFFCSTSQACEQTAYQLQICLRDPEIRFYHAGLSPGLRKSREKWFFDSDRGILIATCAYGMALFPM